MASAAWICGSLLPPRPSASRSCQPSSVSSTRLREKSKGTTRRRSVAHDRRSSARGG